MHIYRNGRFFILAQIKEVLRSTIKLANRNHTIYYQNIGNNYNIKNIMKEGDGL